MQFLSQIQIPIPNKYLDVDIKAWLFEIEKVDKGLTVPKLIVWPIIHPKVMKKGFIESP